MSLVPTRDEVPQIVRYSGTTGHRQQPPSGRAAAGGFTGKDFLRVLRQRWLLILLSLLIFTSISVVATLIWLRFWPFYTASSLLVVNPPKTTMMRGEQAVLSKEMMDRIMQTHAQSVQTEKVLTRAIDDIRQTSWYDEASRGAGDVIQDLSEEVRVSIVPQTTLLRVSMTGRNKEDITEIVNAVSEAAVEDTRIFANADRQSLIDKLVKERQNVEKIRSDRLDTIRTLHRRGIGGEAVEAQQTLTFKTQALVRQMTIVRSEYIEAQKALAMVQEQTDEELADMPEVQQYLQFDPLLRQLENRASILEFELEAVKEKYKENHKIVKDLQTRLNLGKLFYERKRKEVLAKAISSLKMTRESMFLGLQASYLSLEDQVRENDTKLKTLQTLLTNLNQAMEEKGQADDSLVLLDARIMDLRLVQRGEQPLVMHRRARRPREVTMPKWPIMVPVGVLLGLIFGLGIAFLLEFMDTSIKAPSDISRKVDLPLLGMVPHLEDVEEDIEDLRVAFISNPNTIICEAFRQIRATLMFSGPAEQRRSILVTSPMPEDGRTSICMNLAHCIVSGGKKVLVVDANFRQPMIRKLFPMCPEGGLSSSLTGQADWRKLVNEIEPNFHVMASGPIPPNPTELLGSDQMRQRLEEFYQEYDQVIFDSAPCLVVSDAVILSTIVDGTILVVRAGVNTYGIVQRSRDMISRMGSHILGVVLNGVRVTAGGYLRKSYETFYEYRESQQLTAAAVSSSESSTAETPPGDEFNRDADEEPKG